MSWALLDFADELREVARGLDVARLDDVFWTTWMALHSFASDQADALVCRCVRWGAAPVLTWLTARAVALGG